MCWFGDFGDSGLLGLRVRFWGFMWISGSRAYGVKLWTAARPSALGSTVLYFIYIA